MIILGLLKKIHCMWPTSGRNVFAEVVLHFAITICMPNINLLSGKTQL